MTKNELEERLGVAHDLCGSCAHKPLSAVARQCDCNDRSLPFGTRWWPMNLHSILFHWRLGVADTGQEDVVAQSPCHGYVRRGQA